ncbi:hypothetical protein AaE_015123, partial [Aphanomyces astaci]
FLVARHDALAAQRSAEEEMARLHSLLRAAEADKEAVQVLLEMLTRTQAAQVEASERMARHMERAK